MSVRFDWDEGNWPKRGKHGVTKGEIKAVLAAPLLLEADPEQCEERVRAVGRTPEGRFVFCVFTRRDPLIRPISARYMHLTEFLRHAATTEDVSPPPDG